MIGKDSLCDFGGISEGLLDKHCVVSCWQGKVWIKSLAEATLEGALLPIDKSCLWQVGQKLTLGNLELVLQIRHSPWQKLCRFYNDHLTGFSALTSYPSYRAALLTVVSALLLAGWWEYDLSKESIPMKQEVVNTVSEDFVDSGSADNEKMAKVADDVAEVFRLSGLSVTTSVAGVGEILVRGHFVDDHLLRKVIYSNTMREVSGLGKILVENYRAKSPLVSGVPYSYIDHVVDGEDKYIVTTDGSRYYVGSRLPDNGKLSEINQNYIVVERGGEFFEIPKEKFTVVEMEAHYKQGEDLFSKNADKDLYDGYISEAARLYSVSEAIIRAVIHVESGFDPLAVSHAGAMGLMQLMPDTADSLDVTNPFDPYQNIHGGAKHLKSLLKRYGNNLTLALAAYNAGEGAVARYGGVPPYQETRDYVAKVQRLVSSYDDTPVR
ncbi:transglycosylase SLT domain-containing protein [Hahella sp. CCB-MM4]|uniref:transglycosylase SLT domain-containing protein n=1 Tax=Hahella sp. (strain CCB-MM4) TaxID=1926491 RepID=UPI0027392028|nr:transglycosylase SLT domain-containing protein [Hahella sp. CCB-MM4]